MTMTKKILLVPLFSFFLLAQSDLYPIQDYYGGGIGYSPMYMLLDSIPGSVQLNNMGLNTDNFKSPFIVHGGEGFTQIAGRWRLGGYAGTGSSSISNIMDVYFYQETNDSAGIQVPTSQLDETGDKIVQYEGSFRPTINSKFSFTLGAVMLEYVVPVFRDLEVSGGALMGIGRINISIDQHTGEAQWNDMFQNSYGVVSNGNLYYTLESSYSDEEADSVIAALQGTTLSTINGYGGMNDLSGSFFNFQPYIAIKWQIMDRVGLRLSLGYNQGTIGPGKWYLNDRKQIADSPEASLKGLTIRTMFYFGL